MKNTTMAESWVIVTSNNSLSIAGDTVLYLSRQDADADAAAFNKEQAHDRNDWKVECLTDAIRGAIKEACDLAAYED